MWIFQVLLELKPNNTSNVLKNQEESAVPRDANVSIFTKVKFHKNTRAWIGPSNALNKFKNLNIYWKYHKIWIFIT